jgi:phospholipid/cholesterol/gamma-HCH transport system permease protein
LADFVIADTVFNAWACGSVQTQNGPTANLWHVIAEPADARLTTQVDGGDTLVTLSGDWTVRPEGMAAAGDQSWFARKDLKAIRFDTRGLGRWDSSLLVYLAGMRRDAAQRSIRFDDGGIPVAARRLLALLPEKTVAPAPPPRHAILLERVGVAAISGGSELLAVTALLGGQVLQTGAAIVGRARMRRVDLVAHLYDAGIAALPMVALVNVLVGGILAFVGAIELRRFGADIYIANLVGIAQVREMAAVMTAIVMSGRTGGAYAAEIASMQGSNELDALSVFGIPVQDYLILPRVIALTLMTPILYLYGSFVGIVGGFAVAVTMLDISPGLFIAQTRGAVSIDQVIFGLTKSFAFGALIAIAGCRIGLKAGRSTTDVGRAATRAVVAGIIGVIALDAVFAVCANALDI